VLIDDMVDTPALLCSGQGVKEEGAARVVHTSRTRCCPWGRRAHRTSCSMNWWSPTRSAVTGGRDCGRIRQLQWPRAGRDDPSHAR